jgi:hypothetical protein
MFFDELANKYKTHKNGLFIMTPSGAGKTYYCKHQSEPEWIDGDELWIESGAQPLTEWWDMGVPIINAVEQRCDIITSQAIEHGFRVLGSVNYFYKPDAIVIPDWETLTRQIKMRQDSGEYDGGMTESHHEQLKTHIKIIDEWHSKHHVPKFASVTEAITFLTIDD